MRKIIAILAVLSLVVASCKTKYIETVHYQTVEVHDTVNHTTVLRDSITLHDSIYIHQRNDTVYSEKWHTQYKWRTHYDTLYLSKEVPYVVTDTICTIKEVPVEKVVYKQHWWQKLFSGAGILFIVGILIAAYMNLRKLKL